MNCKCTQTGYCDRHGMKVTIGIITRCRVGEFQKPTRRQAVTNYIASTTSHAASGFKLVPLEVRERRQNICNACPHNIDNRCELCNCPLDKTLLGDKLARASEKCKLGKW